MSGSGGDRPELINEKIVGNGSFGTVYQATLVKTGEIVAIKKVLQDKRFKNRELQIMKQLKHTNVVELKSDYLSNGSKPDEVYLNLVLEFVPDTIYRTIKNHSRTKKQIPAIYVKLYMYQVARSLAYIHSMGICHRDIKPQNLLLDSNTHVVKLCDFGSAKMLVRGESNIAYICSRYYRAPELIFGATDYSSAIDTWSHGCVFAELLLGQPLFPGESNVDQNALAGLGFTDIVDMAVKPCPVQLVGGMQVLGTRESEIAQMVEQDVSFRNVKLVEIIKVVGTPTREEIQAMNQNYTEFKFPQIKAHPWSKVFRSKAPPEAIDVVSKLLVYTPDKRVTPLQSCAHTFFDELRDPNTKLPNGRPLPALFDFAAEEMRAGGDIMRKLIPAHAANLAASTASGASAAK